MGDIWAFLQDEKNRALFGWIGGLITAVAGGAWAVWTFIVPRRELSRTKVEERGVEYRRLYELGRSWSIYTYLMNPKRQVNKAEWSRLVQQKATVLNDALSTLSINQELPVPTSLSQANTALETIMTQTAPLMDMVANRFGVMGRKVFTVGFSVGHLVGFYQTEGPESANYKRMADQLRQLPKQFGINAKTIEALLRSPLEESSSLRDELIRMVSRG